jgi:hypothetical protein
VIHLKEGGGLGKARLPKAMPKPHTHAGTAYVSVHTCTHYICLNARMTKAYICLNARRSSAGALLNISSPHFFWKEARTIRIGT